MDDALASEDGIIAVLEPGISVSCISIRQAGRERARFEAFGGPARIGELIELAAASFGVDEWFVDAEVLRSMTLVDERVMEACERFDITLEPFYASPLEPWGPGLEIVIPSGWPDRLDLHPWRELLSWMRGVLRWRVA